jgi:phosphatidylglycerophosphate synthase
VLAGVEKRVLIWMAMRLPAGVSSDHLSAIGLASMGLGGLSFAAFQITPMAGPAVVVCLAANWFGDSLDGTVARARGQERPRYGFYVDHVIDIAGASFLLGGLACSGVMSPILAVALLALYLLVCAETYLATHAAGVFHMSFLGWGPTELRILLAAGALKIMSTPHVSIASFGPVRLFDLAGVVASIALTIVFLVSAVRNTRALYAAEPIPAGTRPKAA